MSGRGRGRGRKNHQVQPPVEIQDLEDIEFNPPPVVEEKPGRAKKPVVKSADELRRVMDIIQSRISVIIDSLEGDDNDISLRRNVVTAVKHLKQINNLLE
jgi:hypothetical protein